MSFLRKLSDVMKEVFWIKKSSKKTLSNQGRKSVRKSSKKFVKKLNTKKKTVLKPVKSQKKPEVKTAVKPPKKIIVKKIKKPEIDPNLNKIGEITHYFERISVCVVKILHGTVLIGDKLTIVGPKHKLVQKVWSMQVESQDVKIAKKGQLIGLKVEKPVGVGDVVYK